MPATKVPTQSEQSTDARLAALLEDAFRRGGVEPSDELERMRARAAEAEANAEKRAKAQALQRSRSSYEDELRRGATALATSQKIEHGQRVSRPTAPEGAESETRKRRLKGARFPNRPARDLGQSTHVPGSRRAYVAGRAITLDASGRQARRALAELPRWYAARVMRAIRTALGSLRWGHVWARQAVGLAVMVWRSSIPARRRGFARVTRGLGRAWFAAGLVNPQHGDGYAVSTLFGCREGARGAPAAELARAGAWVRVQPPSSAVGPDELGPSGWAFGQFWLPRASELDADRLEVAALLPAAGSTPAAEPRATAPP